LPEILAVIVRSLRDITIAEDDSDEGSELLKAVGERLARISLEARDDDDDDNPVALPLDARGAGRDSPSEPLSRNEPSEPPLTAHPEVNVVKLKATVTTLKNLTIKHRAIFLDDNIHSLRKRLRCKVY
jgi:hypothetical protein